MARIFHNLFRKLLCLAIFGVVHTTIIQPAILIFSLFNQSNTELAELHWEEGPQEEKQEKDAEDKIFELINLNISEYLFVYLQKLEIHNRPTTMSMFISTIPIPPPERA